MGQSDLRIVSYGILGIPWCHEKQEAAMTKIIFFLIILLILFGGMAVKTPELLLEIAKLNEQVQALQEKFDRCQADQQVYQVMCHESVAAIQLQLDRAIKDNQGQNDLIKDLRQQLEEKATACSAAADPAAGAIIQMPLDLEPELLLLVPPALITLVLLVLWQRSLRLRPAMTGGQPPKHLRNSGQSTRITVRMNEQQYRSYKQWLESEVGACSTR
jgi:hypothetical protein